MKRNIAAGVNERLKQKFKPHLITSAFVLVLMLGVVDYATGAELNISIFYLLPISLMAWFVNRKTGILSSIVSAAVGLTADLIAGHTYLHPMIVY